MGALHEGHLSLVNLARATCDCVVVSIFVNPTQFGPHEDFARYPRTPERDLDLLRTAGVNLVWLPAVSEMYREHSTITVDPGPVGVLYEGAARPGHFRGVLTVVAKLLNQVQPDVAVFGQKDAQQLFLIRRLVADLQFPVEIVAGETIREVDGLAKSSRNAYLKEGERGLAPTLFRALQAGVSCLASGARETTAIERAMLDEAQGANLVLDYLTVVGEDDFVRPDTVTCEVRLIGAIRIGSVRLLDNLAWKG
jgi:pantoate--beta-alanine ligase